MVMNATAIKAPRIKTFHSPAAPALDELMLRKKYIKDLIKTGRYSSLAEQGEPLDYFRRIIQEINARNYTGLLTVAYEFGLPLDLLDRMLDRKSADVFRLNQMPRSCEIQALHLMFSPRAEELKLTQLGGESELDEAHLRKLYFSIVSNQPGTETLELVRELSLRKMFDYIWDKGVHGHFNSRYRALKGLPAADLLVPQVIQEIGLPALFDESALIKRYAASKNTADRKAKDLKDELAFENAIKSEITGKLDGIYDMLRNFPCDFGVLREALKDAGMELEVDLIEQAGLSALRDYIRGQGLLGARLVSERYGLVCPVLSYSDPAQARHTINSSFYEQGLKSKKGRYFLRAEVLYNLQPFVKEGRCHKLPGGYLLALIETIDGEEHYLFGRFPSRVEQINFILTALGYFFFFDSPQRAVASLVKHYLERFSGNVRVNHAVKKMLVALPIVLGLAFLVGILYYLTFGRLAESALVGGGITFVGMAIAWKNGYDEEITPASHESIPAYLARKGTRVIATTSALELGTAEEAGQEPAEEE